MCCVYIPVYICGLLTATTPHESERERERERERATGYATETGMCIDVLCFHIYIYMFTYEVCVL